MLPNEDIRACINCDLDDLGNENMLDLYNKHLVDGLGNIKPEYKVLQNKVFFIDRSLSIF